MADHNLKVNTMYNGVNKTNHGTYLATFYMNGETIRIGEYATDVEAALAYDITVSATLGGFAVGINFPELSEEEAFVALTGNS